jgi:myosin-1
MLTARRGQTVRNAMNIIGFSEQEQHDILQLVAAILHLGNVSFQEAGQGAQVADENALQMAAYLLQVEPFTLQNALTFRVMQTGTAGGKQSTYNVPLNREQAEGTRDALAKAIYDRLFDYIVRRVNEALMLKRMPHVAHIGVLDIFGFEIFEKNGFEQFCINYVNEKLQQYFIELTLKAEQEEYVREGIKWEQINYFNNQVVVDLIEGKKPPGLFSLLDDVCATIHAQAGFEVDMKFLQKAYAMFSQHQHFRPLDTAFVIKHYAGDVTYEVEGFCDKNKDTLFPDLVEAMQTSQLPFLVSLFPEEVSTKEQKKRPTTAGFKIRNSAQALMHALSQCTPHYIRCIKPNDNKAPNDYNESRVRHQVKYLGLLENVRVRRAGWAYRSEFARFLNKYKKLSRRTYGMWGEFQGNPAEGCKIILQDMNIEPSQWQLGKTKVFIRFPETLFHLEECLERRDYDCLTRIQQAWRAWKLRKKALEQRAAAADLLRGKKERQRASVGRKFLYDYGAYADNFALQEVIGQGEAMLFCDQVSRLNRRSKPERRDLVLTDQALYIVMRQRRNNIICYVVKSRVPLASLRAVSLSTLADNYFVLHTSGPDADLLLESEHKTELLVLLRERVPGLRIDFIDSIQYKISTGDTRTINFTKNESATRVQLKKSGKTLTVLIASGLPRDTDTTPKMIQTRGQYQVQPRPAQPKQQKQQQQQQQQQRPQPKPAAAPSAQKSAAAAAAGAGRAKPVAGQAAKPAAAKPAGAKGKAVAKPAAAAAAAGGGQRSLPTPGQANPKAAAGKPAAAPRPQPKPPAPSKPQARALYDYDAGGPDEISFREGDIIIIHTKDPGGWWEGELNGVRGWVRCFFYYRLSSLSLSVCVCASHNQVSHFIIVIVTSPSSNLPQLPANYVQEL